MYKLFSEYYFKRFTNLYIVNMDKKCKKNYDELYFGGTKYCIKKDKIDANSLLFF